MKTELEGRTLDFALRTPIGPADVSKLQQEARELTAILTTIGKKAKRR